MKKINIILIFLFCINSKLICKNEDFLFNCIKKLNLYFNLKPYNTDQLADFWYDGEPYKKLIPDTSIIFSGCEFVSVVDDTIKYILTKKIGFVWIWYQFDRGKYVKDDAIYMSIWDRTPEYKNKSVVSIEMCKVDCGNNIQHLLVISDSIFIKIKWNDIQNNNPYLYLWFVK